MEDIIERIQGYAVEIDPSIEEEPSLEFVVNDVVDRFLVYTNRDQLVENYEDETLEDQPVPVPVRVERTLARVVVSAFKNLETLVSGERSVTKVKDGVQEVTYGDGITSYMASKSDGEIFDQAREVIDKFRIPTVVENR